MKYPIALLLWLLSCFCAYAQELSVYVFLGTECPLSREQTYNLNQAQATWGEQVQFYAVFPNKSDSQEAIEAFASKYKLKCSLIADPHHKWVNTLQASVTPEAFLLNKDGSILYLGQIDNRMQSLGVKRKVVTQNYLGQAISEALAGKEISIKRTRAVGCSIFHKM